MHRNCHARSVQNRQTLNQKCAAPKVRAAKAMPVLSVPNVPDKKYAADYVDLFPTGPSTGWGYNWGLPRPREHDNQRQRRKKQRQ